MHPFTLSRSFRAFLGLGLLALVTAGCSVDVIPVHSSRVNSARKADQPLARGPKAPGAFRQGWEFTRAEGFVLDPGKVEIADGLARAKKLASGKYPLDRDRAVIETTGGIPFIALDGFSEKTGPRSRGVIRYQLSPDGSRWFYHDGEKWITAGPAADQTNTAQELATRVQNFHAQVGIGSLFVKAALISPTGAEPVELAAIQVEGIAPKTDGWD